MIAKRPDPVEQFREELRNELRVFLASKKTIEALNQSKKRFEPLREEAKELNLDMAVEYRRAVDYLKESGAKE